MAVKLGGAMRPSFLSCEKMPRNSEKGLQSTAESKGSSGNIGNKYAKEWGEKGTLKQAKGSLETNRENENDGFKLRSGGKNLPAALRGDGGGISGRCRFKN